MIIENNSENNAGIPDVQHLVTQLAYLQASYKRIGGLIEQTKDELAQLLPDGGMVGDSRVIVSWTRRLDARKIKENFPPEQFPQLYTPQIDTKRVREHISPARLHDFEQVSAKPVVSIR